MILNVGGIYDRAQQQTCRIYKDMALLACDLLASVKAMGIDAGLPFSALMTLWLSMIAVHRSILVQYRLRLLEPSDKIARANNRLEHDRTPRVTQPQTIML